VNFQYAEECYECTVVSNKNACQIRPGLTLRHKAQFAYESLCISQTGLTDGCPPYGQQRRCEVGVTPARSASGSPMVAIRGALGALGAHHAHPGRRHAMSAAPMDRRWWPRWHPRRCCRTIPTPSWRPGRETAGTMEGLGRPPVWEDALVGRVPSEDR